MLFAIIQSGGKQYKASVGQKVRIEKLPQETGENVVFTDVLLAADGDKVSLGAPTVVGASVSAKVVLQGKGEKQIIFKMKPKKRYRVKTGHRQRFTEVEITKISVGRTAVRK